MVIAITEVIIQRSFQIEVVSILVLPDTSIFRSGLCTKKNRCLCAKGYIGKHCENDIEECVTGNHFCVSDLSQCKNIEGSYICVCNEGYVLQKGNLDLFFIIFGVSSCVFGFQDLLLNPPEKQMQLTTQMKF